MARIKQIRSTKSGSLKYGKHERKMVIVDSLEQLQDLSILNPGALDGATTIATTMSSTTVANSLVAPRANAIVLGGTGSPASQTLTFANNMYTTAYSTVECKLSFKWSYVRKGVEKEGRKIVSIWQHSYNDAWLNDYVARITEYIEQYTNPAEPVGAYLHIFVSGKQVRKIGCPYRMMYRIKRKFSIING